MKIKNATSLILCILFCQIVGGLGALWTTPEINGWFSTLQKPSFNPPNWIFGPVWTTLYFLMGISLWLILQTEKSNPKRKTVLIAFFVQLFLNGLWSFLFFKIHSPLIAFIDIVFIWLSIIFWLWKTYSVSKKAALINVPYFFWVSFASVLNFYIFVLNR